MSSSDEEYKEETSEDEEEEWEEEEDEVVCRGKFGANLTNKRIVARKKRSSAPKKKEPKRKRRAKKHDDDDGGGNIESFLVVAEKKVENPQTNIIICKEDIFNKYVPFVVLAEGESREEAMEVLRHLVENDLTIIDYNFGGRDVQKDVTSMVQSGLLTTKHEPRDKSRSPWLGSAFRNNPHNLKLLQESAMCLTFMQEVLEGTGGIVSNFFATSYLPPATSSREMNGHFGFHQDHFVGNHYRLLLTLGDSEEGKRMTFSICDTIPSNENPGRRVTLSIPHGRVVLLNRCVSQAGILLLLYLSQTMHDTSRYISGHSYDSKIWHSVFNCEGTMTLAFEFAHNTREVTDHEIQLLTNAMHRHSLSVHETTKVHLPKFTDVCLRSEFNIGLSTADVGTYAQFGILPADFFEGNTRKERLFTRSIACIAKQNNMDPKDLFIKTSHEGDKVISVQCVRCGDPLKSEALANLITTMKKHVKACTGRRTCINCKVDFPSVGICGHSRLSHERTCLPEDQFLEKLDWIDCAGKMAVNTKTYGQLGFSKSGYPNEGPKFSESECIKMYDYIRTRLFLTGKPRNMFNNPRYHRILAAVNTNLRRLGKKQLANKFAITNH
jgi:hypothetical protein